MLRRNTQTIDDMSLEDELLQGYASLAYAAEEAIPSLDDDETGEGAPSPERRKIPGEDSVQV